MVQTLRSLPWAATLTLLLLSQARAASHYEIDPSQTSVAFEVRTLGLSQRGTVRHASGTVSIDEADASASFEVQVDARTLDAESAGLRKLLRGASLLDVERYPEIAYRARRVSLVGGRLRTVVGDLTLRGVTRPVALSVVDGHCASTQAVHEPCRLTATATFRRSEFGMNRYLAFASDEVKLVVTAVAHPVEALREAR